LLWGREALALGLRWRIGDGSKVRLLADLWIPRPSTFKPITSVNVINEDWKVVDIILDRLRRSNEELISNIFCEMDRDCIATILLSLEGGEDSLCWHYESKGQYSVKFGYKAVMANMGNPPGDSRPHPDRNDGILFGVFVFLARSNYLFGGASTISSLAF
ncbi:hypothetical protein PanWU01x14_021390, partial [Parasponia andersonii]